MRKMILSSVFCFIVLIACESNAQYEGFYGGLTNEGEIFWMHVNDSDGIEWYAIQYKVYNGNNTYLGWSGQTTHYSFSQFATIDNDSFDYHHQPSQYSEETRLTGTFNGPSASGSYLWNNHDFSSYNLEKTSDSLSWSVTKQSPNIIISRHPIDSTAAVGDTVTFTVAATFGSGTSNDSYQWKKDGQMISSFENRSARTTTLELENIQEGDNGSTYTCYIYSFADGLIASASAKLNVVSGLLIGDVDTSGGLALADAIVSLQVIVDSVPDLVTLDPQATIEQGTGIGLREAIYIMKTLSESP